MIKPQFDDVMPLTVYWKRF